MSPAPPAAPRAGPPRTALIMLAGGDGQRAGHDTNKVLLPLAGRRVFTWSIRWARELAHVTHTVLVIREQDRETVMATLDREVEDPAVIVVPGGTSRHGSEWAGLRVLAPAIEAGEVDVVVIHDAARPLASTELFASVIEAGHSFGGALPALTQGSLAAMVDGLEPPARRVIAVQTPQAFVAKPLLSAYTRAAEDGFVGTDTASCMERYTELPVHWVPGDARNVKITFPEDLFLAERLLARAEWDLSHRVGRTASVPHRQAHWRDRWRRGEQP